MQGLHDPQNTKWAKDQSRFGMKMLQKMGWKDGAGLGAKEQGATVFLKVEKKEDLSGMQHRLVSVVIAHVLQALGLRGVPSSTCRGRKTLPI